MPQNLATAKPLPAQSPMRITAYHSQADIPMQEAKSLLQAHVSWAYHEFRALGAPEFDVQVHFRRFFADMSPVLPPRGAYMLAHDGDGRVVGTGALRRVSDDVAEMKHLYVVPEARGTGLGQALIERRIAAARALGIKELVADTFAGNTPMIRLYHRLGFADSAPYDSAVSKITPELIPHLCFFRMPL